MTPDDIKILTDKKNRYRTDEYTRERYGCSRNPPEKCIKRRRNPVDLIHNEDDEGPDCVKSPETPDTEVLEDDVP